MSSTANLVLPFLAVGQAQKHVTVNEALRKLDAIIQLSVVSATTTAQPASPSDGEVWILPSGKSGADWSAFADGSLAYYRDGVWVVLTPREGWLAFAKDTGELLAFAGASWSLFPAGKVLTVSAPDKVLGRSSLGAGPAEEIACTAAGRALLDDADAAAQRDTLGAASLGANTFTGTQTIEDSTAGALIEAIEYRTAGAGATFRGSHARGAKGSETQVLANDQLTQLLGRGWHSGGAMSGNVAAFAFRAYEDFTSSAQGTYFEVATTPSGATGRITRLIVDHDGTTRPAADDTYNLGVGSFRWKEVFSANGVINTSDAREKTELRPLADAERRAIRRVIGGIGVYHWRDALNAKGEAARLHCGITAQALAEAFAAEGLDASRYGVFCADEIETRKDGGKSVRYGVRYDQLFAMALAALITAG